MLKLTCALLIVALVYCVGVYADDDSTNQLTATPTFGTFNIPKTAEDIIGLERQKGGDVRGTYTESHSSVEMVNGKVVKHESGGQDIQNNNEQITRTSYSS